MSNAVDLSIYDRPCCPEAEGEPIYYCNNCPEKDRARCASCALNCNQNGHKLQKLSEVIKIMEKNIQTLLEENPAYFDAFQLEFARFQAEIIQEESENEKQKNKVQDTYQNFSNKLEEKIARLQIQEEQTKNSNLQYLNASYQKVQEELRELLKLESALSSNFEKICKGEDDHENSDMFSKLPEKFDQIVNNSKVSNCEVNLFGLVTDVTDIEDDIANLVGISKSREVKTITFKISESI